MLSLCFKIINKRSLMYLHFLEQIPCFITQETKLLCITCWLILHIWQLKWSENFESQILKCFTYNKDYFIKKRRISVEE